MLGWLFKKKIEQKFEELHTPIKNSFQTIRDDMGQVSEWLSHFKEKHKAHDTNFEDLQKQIQFLSGRLAFLEENITEEDLVKSETLEKEEPQSNEKHLELPSGHNLHKELPPAQENLCRVLASLQREEPNKWVSLKKLGQELWPNREYSKSRSAVAQLVNVLEVEGYITKKRVRKSVYIYLKKNKYAQKTLKQKAK